MNYGVDDLVRDLGFRPTDEQLAAITADLSRPLLVVAGAGSGKTTVMSARVRWAVATGQVDPARVLGLTFTVKAAAQLGQRFRLFAAADSGVGFTRDRDGAGEPEASTYHSFAHRLITEHGIRIGFEPGFRLLSGADQAHFAHRVVVRSHLKLARVNRNPAKVVSSLIDLDGRLAEHSVTTDELRKFDVELVERVALMPKPTKPVLDIAEKAAARIELSRLVDDFRSAKVAAGVADFSDLMRLVDRLVAEQLEVGEIARARYEMVLLDEYQDTSPVQTAFLSKLFGGGHPVTAVGDPLQSIFGWRAASAASIAGFPRLFPDTDGVDARVLRLSVNQRSSSEILSAANRIARPLLKRHPTAVELLPADARVGKGEVPVEIALFDTSLEEVRRLGEQVAEELAGGTPPDEMAVLVRATDYGRAVIDQLAERGIRAHWAGVEGLLDQPEVIDIVGMLEAAFEPSANRAVVRLLGGPRWRIGTRDLAGLGRRAADLAQRGPVGSTGDDDSGLPRHMRALEEAVAGVDPVELPSLGEALANPGSVSRYGYSDEAVERFGEFARELDRLRELRELPVSDLVSEVIDSTGMGVELQLWALRDPARGAAALAVVDQFRGFVDGFEEGGERAGVGGFLSYIAAISRLDTRVEVSLPAQPGSVQVLTVHKAKGLEWDVVFVPFVAKSVFPSGRSSSTWTGDLSELPTTLRGDRDTQPRLSELSNKSIADYKAEVRAKDELDERQLAYVALTRARRRMIVSGHWWGPTQTRPRGPSVILAELYSGSTPEAVHQWAEEPPVGAGNPALTKAVQRSEPGPVDRQAVTRPEVELNPDGDRFAELTPAELTPAERDAMREWEQAITRVFRPERHVAGLAGVDASQWSASSAVELVQDPSGFAARRRRPVPRPTSAAAREGTSFHLWVQEYYGRPTLFDPFDGDAEVEVEDNLGLAAPGCRSELEVLQAGFRASGYAERRPEVVEWPFSVVIGGRVLTGQIDAVFATPDGGWEVVDWKTNANADADPFQLALYRAAWARINRVQPERITGVFVYVRLDRVVRYRDLADEDQIAGILADAGSTAAGTDPAWPADSGPNRAEST